MKLLAVAIALAACSSPHPHRARDLALHDRISRDDFNRFAVRTNQPIFWLADANRNQRVEPDEIVSLLLYPEPGRWVEDGRFTPAFDAAYERIVAAHRDLAPGGDDIVPDPPGDPGQLVRRRAVGAELDFGRVALVRADVPRDAILFVRHVLAAAALVDRAPATGIARDLESASLVRRNHEPRCVAGRPYRDDPRCTAIPDTPVARFVAAIAVSAAPDRAAIATELAAAADAVTDPALAAALRHAPATTITTSWYLHATETGLTLGLVDPRSLDWQARLAPLRVPELVDVVVAAGSDRAPLGGSLVQDGVVLANLYADPDSRAARRVLAESLFDRAAMRDYADDSEPWLLAAMLRVASRESAFPDVAALRELARLRAAGTFSDELARHAAIATLFDLLGRTHELYSDGKRTPGDNTVATEIGALCDRRVLTWSDTAHSANETLGTFALDLDQLATTADQLEADPATALSRYRGESGPPFGIVAYRVAMAPAPSFVYAEVP